MKEVNIVTILLLISGTIGMASPKADVEELMNKLIPFGQQMREKYGEFFPYGGAMKPDGEIIYHAGYDEGEEPLSQDIIKLLKDGYRLAAKKGEFKATAIFYDIRVIPPDSEEKTDAIAVALDHKEDSLASVQSNLTRLGVNGFGTFCRKKRASAAGPKPRITEKQLNTLVVIQRLHKPPLPHFALSSRPTPERALEFKTYLAMKI